MRESRLERWLGRLIPERVRVEVWLPALRDLQIRRAETRNAAGVRRRAASPIHVLSIVLLLLDCWRVRFVEMLIHVAGFRWRSAPGERLSMIAWYVRHAFSRLVREPGFTIAAALTLALGVGANVAVFALVEAVLLRPLPYASAESLVILNHRDTRTGITKEFIAIGDYVDITQRQTAFDGVVTYSNYRATMYEGGEAASVGVLLAGAGMFELMKVRAALGRGIEESDTRDGAAPVAVLMWNLWRDQYGSDPGVLGRSIRIGQTSYTVVGVAPEGFGFPPSSSAGVMLPSEVPLEAPASRKSSWIFAVARLAEGQTIESATANLAAISQQMADEHPDQNTGSTYYATPLRDALVGSTRPALLLMMAAVGLVLLIACANVANLQLARALSRRREMAVRLALGAGRGRLATLLLAENLALALVAAAAGILFAHWGGRALVALVPSSVQAPGLADVGLNVRVLAFAIGIVVGTALLFGVIAAMMVRVDTASDVLVSAGRASVSRLVRRAASGLVAIEVALAIVLLVGAGLVLRTFGTLLSVDPGFRYERVMTMWVQLPVERYGAVEAREAFWNQAFERVRAIPGVLDVGTAVVTPLTGNNWTAPFERADHPVAPGERPPDVGWQNASGGYFRAMQIPLVSGRLFDERDVPGGQPVVIISEAIAEQHFPDTDPVGMQIRLGNATPLIVGVVGDIRRAALTDQPRADMYFPFETNPAVETTLFVRTAAEPESFGAELRDAIRSVDQAAALGTPRSMSDIASESVRTTRLLLWLLGVFALCALALAAVGIYGVMAYTVRQRTREIGTRMAVGATRAEIVRLVLRQGGAVAVAGMAIGLGVSLMVTRALRSVLFGVSPSDPLTLAVAMAVLAVAAAVACLVPARRASAIDPARTLAQQ